MKSIHEFCTFHLDSAFYGVDVACVQEIVRFLPMTRLPLAPPEIRGLINLRGQIVTTVDLRRRLELPGAPSGVRPTNVVVRTDTGVVSFLVDEVGDVIEVEEKAREKPPETLRGPARDLIQNAFKLPDRLLLILDINKVVTFNPLP